MCVYFSHAYQGGAFVVLQKAWKHKSQSIVKYGFMVAIEVCFTYLHHSNTYRYSSPIYLEQCLQCKEHDKNLIQAPQ